MAQDARRWSVDDFLSRKITRNIPNLKAKKEETIMRKSKMKITILGCVGVFLIAALILVPAKQAKAETQVESSLIFRIYVAYSVDQTAVQAWLPSPWKAVSLPKGPFKGANLFVLFDDKLIHQDAEGKPVMGGIYCATVLVAFGKNLQTKEFAPFVIRIYWPYDDPHGYKNAVKATVSREAAIKGGTPKSGLGSEIWKVQDSAGEILELRMDYHRVVPKRIKKREFKVRSSVEPDFFRIYRDDYAVGLVKSIPAGINRMKYYRFRSTIPELRKMFDGSEQLVGISVNPVHVRQVFLP
jgi:hypothetical protein